MTNAFKDGLPYDFDQVRVFTWNVKKHRYETAYRQRNVQGYLPVVVSESKGAQGQSVPGFAITVGTSDAVNIDPATGAARPAQTDTLHYQLEGGMVKRVTPGRSAGSSSGIHQAEGGTARIRIAITKAEGRAGFRAFRRPSNSSHRYSAARCGYFARNCQRMGAVAMHARRSESPEW